MDETNQEAVIESDTENLGDTEPKIYEIGYLLVPFIPAEAVGEAVTKEIKAKILALGGTVTSEMDPVMTKLAYTVRKTIANKINKFNDAYFGALRFKLPADRTITLKEELRKSDQLLRFLLIVLPKGSEIIVVPRRTYQRRDNRPFEIERIEKKEELKPELTKEEIGKEIDKEIENLLEEDTAKVAEVKE